MVLAEVPTGIVADVYSRRLSVIVGFVIVGIGFLLMGAVPRFWCITLGSVLWAIGGTFISGAHQAWLADELRGEPPGPIYLRGTQLAQLSALAGIPFGVALASHGLQLPMLMGGLGFWLLAAVMVVVMKEHGYVPVSRAGGHPWREMKATLREGIAAVRARPAVMTMLPIVVVYGAAGEAVGRLSPLHFIANVGLPATLSEATWFGVLQAGSFLGAAIITWGAGRAKAVNSPRVLVQILALLTAVMLMATLTFALASAFWVALLAFWAARWTRIALWPLVVTRINHDLEPGVRATVISIAGQGEALGEAAGGPALGLIGTMVTVRAALVGAATVLVPAFPLYGRVLAADEPGRRRPPVDAGR